MLLKVWRRAGELGGMWGAAVLACCVMSCLQLPQFCSLTCHLLPTAACCCRRQLVLVAVAVLC